MIIWIATLGEVLGYIVSLILVRVRLEVSLRELVLPLLGSVVLMGTCIWFADIRATGQGSIALLLTELVLYAALTGAILWSCRDLRRYISKRHINAAES